MRARLASGLLFCTLVVLQMGGPAAGGTLADSTRTWSKGRERMARAVVETRQLSEPCRDEEYWGTDAGRPQVVVGCTIYVGSKAIDVPRSAYADLASPSVVKCHAGRDSLVIEIRGGETATAYMATITVVGLRVVGRQVRDVELPDDVWERTSYHFRN